MRRISSTKRTTVGSSSSNTISISKLKPQNLRDPDVKNKAKTEIKWRRKSNAFAYLVRCVLVGHPGSVRRSAAQCCVHRKQMTETSKQKGAAFHCWSNKTPNHRPVQFGTQLIGVGSVAFPAWRYTDIESGDIKLVQTL